MEDRMNRKKIDLLLVLLALLLCTAGCVAPPADTGEGQTTSPSDPQASESASDATVTDQPPIDILYPYVTDVDESVLTTKKDQAYLLLANKEHALPSSYAPSSVTRISDMYTHYHEELEMESRAAAALEAMIREMYAVGIYDVMVTSAYRSYSYQQQLYNLYLHKEQTNFTHEAYLCLGEDYIMEKYAKYFDENGGTKPGDGLDYTDAVRVVASYSALPGQSEHQTGLCVDLITSDMEDELTVAFENTAAFAYLSENAHKFGFILRYPKGKEDVTGYMYEPWHYRFVGREAATEIYRLGLTLEEYLQQADAATDE